MLKDAHDKHMGNLSRFKKRKLKNKKRKAKKGKTVRQLTEEEALRKIKLDQFSFKVLKDDILTKPSETKFSVRKSEIIDND